MVMRIFIPVVCDQTTPGQITTRQERHAIANNVHMRWFLSRTVPDSFVFI